MARKGNHQKNGMDRHSSNHKVKNMEPCGGPLQDEKENTKAGMSKINGEEFPNRNQSGSPSVERMNRTKISKDEKKGNQKSRKTPVKEKPVPENMHDCLHSPSVDAYPKECEDASSFNVSHFRRNDETSLGSDQSSKNPTDGLGGSQRGVSTEDMKEGSWSFESMVSRRLGASALSIFRAANGWLESKKPLFTTITTSLFGFRDYVRFQAEKAYPIFLRWLVHLGNLILLISMIWLDCTARGFVSFFRLGTTSFFVVIWCSTLSVFAMVGASKFLLILVVAALSSYFVGLTLAALLVSILTTVFLWIYGSFWTTGLVTFVGGLTFALHFERFALLITTIYSIYSAKSYVGWLGLFLGLNLSFISSDVLIHFLKNNMHEHNRSNRPHEEAAGMRGPPGSFFTEPMHASPSEASGRSADRNAGETSTSGHDAELTSEEEVIRLLNCTDHYSALGLSRYETVDVSVLKREYRKKAMLVHPDKNMGNEKAAEAFKKLQNAYEILLDSLKRKAYDDELRREDLLNWFRSSQNISHKNGRSGRENEDLHGESRRIACKKCSSYHIWILTNRSKSQARWCQECNDFHQAKDGDGWVEQSSQPLFFGLLQKVDAPCAYICAESRIYDATEWFVCQGMRCPANAHKPSFHVNTSVTSSSKHGGSAGGQRGGIDMEDIMTEDEFLEWLQRAMQSGAFEATTSNPSTDTKTGSYPKAGGSSSKKKKKGKKQW
ncbi:hypothetical protein ACHQM5_017199 [Ranunculus cassubicifolius]